MIKDNEKQKNIYTTLDSYQAGFLTLRKHIPKLIEQGNKIVFCFDATPELFQTINEYNSGASIDAIRFALAIKTLKSQIHSMRRNNDNRPL